MNQADWEGLGPDEAIRFARSLAGRVPGATFTEIRQKTAFYQIGDLRMALIFGGRAELGWRRRPVANLEALYARDREQLEWYSPILHIVGAVKEPLPDPGLDPWLWLESVLSPPRHVEVPPMLVAVEPQSGELPPGCRLLTSDEWEYLSSGGSGDLFRWGNIWPTECWDEGSFTQHQAPNSFGLLFTADPYETERVSDPKVMRGGDGGELNCAGVGPLSWVTFASSYVCRSPSIVEHPDVWDESCWVRPALDVRIL